MALHERTGWQIVGLYCKKYGDSSHYLVRRPDGLLVDVRGIRTEAEVLAQWGGDAPADFYSFRDYTADHLHHEVTRGYLEDPRDVWPLAISLASTLAA